jgi:sugar phosphate isomerase/epimerase
MGSTRRSVPPPADAPEARLAAVPYLRRSRERELDAACVRNLPAREPRLSWENWRRAMEELRDEAWAEAFKKTALGREGQEALRHR